MTKSIRRVVTGALLSLIAIVGLVSVPSQASAAPNYYGSIAISVRTGNASYAIDFPSPASAKRAAIRKCGARDCQWVVLMHNNCGAAAQQPYTRRWGWAYGPTRNRAVNAARNAAGRGSRTIVWACTTRPRY
ncbi:hypothetical protein GOEFS_092_00550 [Gordonia effusa NBRC 100432]|uniref:DUF4189 domain-containing protein n=1 Tax=Gordonia effusa NBRC 100432 TaxID=1077974 RepID=H0R3H9_9ACTN|nr:DUF4189 domain-containing protein [Gordonia effusa]GAB19630.1 hypothetical protein GOEFS_092_00550 [Gordonia effusa NBRC 100432]